MKKTALTIALAAIITIAVTVAASAAVYDLFKVRTFRVAAVADIHLGTARCDWKQCNTMVENSFKEFLENTDHMLVISAGDNVDASEFHDEPEKAAALREDYGKKLLEMAGDRIVLWTNGNHDRETYLSGKEYFSYDENGWRFIVIHTPDVAGEQYDWLADQLKTDKKVMILMHHPVFNNKSKKLMNCYVKIEKLFSENKVRYVLSGHWHYTDYEKNYNGVIYKAIPGLTYNRRTNYKIMDLEYKKIETWNLPPFIRNLLVKYGLLG